MTVALLQRLCLGGGASPCNIEQCNYNSIQAGLSRTTLEISSEISSYFPLRTLESGKYDQWLLIYSTFNILRSSFMGGRLNF